MTTEDRGKFATFFLEHWGWPRSFCPIPYWAKDLKIGFSTINARAEEIESKPAESSSVHYWASPLEGRLCAGQEVVLVGAGIR